MSSEGSRSSWHVSNHQDQAQRRVCECDQVVEGEEAFGMAAGLGLFEQGLEQMPILIDVASRFGLSACKANRRVLMSLSSSTLG